MKHEIEITHPQDPDAWKDWIVIECNDGGTVSISHDYQRPGCERRTWYDEGSSFGTEYLDDMINVLTALRDDLSR